MFSTWKFNDPNEYFALKMNTKMKMKNILYRKFFLPEIKNNEDRFEKVYFLDYKIWEKWIFLKIIFN